MEEAQASLEKPVVEAWAAAVAAYLVAPEVIPVVVCLAEVVE